MNETPKMFSKSLLIGLSMICAIVVASLYYDQVLLSDISKDYTIGGAALGGLITAIQIGYTLGLLFLVPLGDRYSKKKLILITMCSSAVLLAVMSQMPSFPLLVITGFFMGLSSVSAQLIIPFVSSHVHTEQRGVIVGHLLTGIFLGVLLGRVTGGVLGQLWGWKSVHILAACVLFFAACYLYFKLPEDTMKKEESYKKIIASIPPLLRKEKVLQETIVFGAAAFCAFNIFWVSLSFILEGKPYHYGSAVTGMFGFIGIAGAVAAGFSGKLTNHKKVHIWNLIALGIMFCSFVLMGFGWSYLIVLIVITFVLDVGSRMNMTINQGRIYKLNPINHSRLNSIYMVGYYLGGSLGSWISTMVYHSFHTIGVAVVSSGILSLAFLYYFIKKEYETKKEKEICVS